ncbi:ribokinase [Bacillus tianshenii]|nr:ribokinase [Bacillus tianshenii]
MSKVAVLGSFVVDLTSFVQRLPEPGETLLGSQFLMGPGGKGGNQAVAAKRLGTDVQMIGRVGDDFFGKMAVKNFENEGIGIKHLVIDDSYPTGTAQILVGDDSENSIVVVSGANKALDEQQVEQAQSVINEADLFLTQFELDLPAVKYGIKLAANKHKTVVVNPAPAQSLEEGMYKYISILTPNETELRTLTNMPVGHLDEVEQAAKWLCKKGVQYVVVTLGKKGALLVSEEKTEHFQANLVDAIDTTGAGDAFNGGLVTALAEGKSIEAAIEFANVVASLSVQKYGTAPSMPYRSDLNI